MRLGLAILAVAPVSALTIRHDTTDEDFYYPARCRTQAFVSPRHPPDRPRKLRGPT
jgi:hypothetical protein